VLKATATCHLVTTEVRAWLLAAAIDMDAGNRTRAHEGLLSALRLTEPVELLQPFTESQRFAALLIGGKGRFAHLATFVDRILEQLPTTDTEGVSPASRLTPAELSLLHDLPSLLTLRKIAAARSVSVNTIKSHLRAIYGKLGVDGRRGAVEVARDRGLLSRGRVTVPTPAAGQPVGTRWSQARLVVMVDPATARSSSLAGRWCSTPLDSSRRWRRRRRSARARCPSRWSCPAPRRPDPAATSSGVHTPPTPPKWSAWLWLYTTAVTGRRSVSVLTSSSAAAATSAVITGSSTIQPDSPGTKLMFDRSRLRTW